MVAFERERLLVVRGQTQTNRGYDPFARGPLPVGVRTLEAFDASRDRRFAIEIWYPAAARHAGQDLAPATQDGFTVASSETPRSQAAVRNAEAQPGTYPLIGVSHSSGGHRRSYAYLATHLASHGYLVAALDHSEVIAPELARKPGETPDQQSARVQAWIANRVPDVRFLLDRLLESGDRDSRAKPDEARIGLVGHSFGGWTVLATPDADRRVGVVVALAPGGSSNPRPGIIPAVLRFDWRRDVPVMVLAGENDVMTPLAGIQELFERTPGTKRMVVLRRADHLHFAEDVEASHEAVRSMSFPPPLDWFPAEMRPIAELTSGDEAHRFTRGLTLLHLDAHLKGREDARTFLAGDLGAELKALGLDAYEPNRVGSSEGPADGLARSRA